MIEVPFAANGFGKKARKLWTWTYCRSQNFQFLHDEGTNRFLDGVFKYVLLSLPFVFSRWVVQPSVLVLLLWWFLSFLLWLPFQHIYSQIPSSNYILIFPLPWKLLHWLIRSVTNTWWNMIKFIGHEVFWNEFRLQRGFLRVVYTHTNRDTATYVYLCHHVQRQQQLGRTPFPAPWWRNKAFHLSIVCTWWMNKSWAVERNLMFEIHHALKKWSKTGCCKTLSYQSIWKVCVSFCNMDLDHLWSVGFSLHASHLLICATGSPRLMDDEAQP